VGVSVTKSGNHALYSNSLHALFYILSLNALMNHFSEAEVLTPVLESTNRKRPEEEPIARRKRERAAQLIEYRRSSNSSFEKTRPTMKITYFDIRGRAETARLVLAYAEVSFEDNRLPFPPNEVWAAKKPSVTLGQLPTLEVEGKTLHQSMAIAR
jgi:hypothetical protein